MSVPLQTIDQQSTEGDRIEHAVGLLSQQVWCWGRDILRPEGNWLLQNGFVCIKPPAERDGCSSVYTLQLPRGRCVVLRGFGAFYGDQRCGGVFLPRYEFRPRYTKHATLEHPLVRGRLARFERASRVTADVLCVPGLGFHRLDTNLRSKHRRAFGNRVPPIDVGQVGQWPATNHTGRGDGACVATSRHRNRRAVPGVHPTMQHAWESTSWLNPLRQDITPQHQHAPDRDGACLSPFADLAAG